MINQPDGGLDWRNEHEQGHGIVLFTSDVDADMEAAVNMQAQVPVDRGEPVSLSPFDALILWRRPYVGPRNEEYG